MIKSKFWEEVTKSRRTLFQKLRLYGEARKANTLILIQFSGVFLCIIFTVRLRAMLYLSAITSKVARLCHCAC
jgi:hypothetical protein